MNRISSFIDRELMLLNSKPGLRDGRVLSKSAALGA